MNYPIDEFVADYRAAMASARNADPADVVSGKALRQPFEAQYEGEALQERILAFQKVMQMIRQKRKELVKLGYAKLGSGSQINWMHHNVVRAFHRLVIDLDKMKPSNDEIRETIEFFVTRN